MKKSMKLFWAALGFLCLGLGTLGIVLPILPTVPFYMATVFCFAKSSEKLHAWFIRTGLYKKYLESYVRNCEMTMAVKCKLVGTSSLVMGIGFFCMKNVPIGRIVLAIVWAGHIWYFFGKVKTVKPEQLNLEMAE